ncbi:Pls/PosA family non-ribosomal peptide synthetase [Pseudonocardia sp. CA-142604]|uniref:Pls/PosA family non-ribosomal peptide synthetase n=1 Tax=Pseudonocardia sp. CA-142604 TaxID=3240024 RepID=UPI003D94F2D8
MTISPRPAFDTERKFAELLADIAHIEQVPVDSNFFDDLGADSMVMARFCARIRKRPDLPAVSMKDIYRHPTVRSLATAFRDAVPAPAPAPAPARAAVPAPRQAPAEESTPAPAPPRANSRQYVLCGALQLLIFLAYSYLAGYIANFGYDWISAGSGVGDVYLRSIIFGDVSVVALCVLPIVAKWVLIGRWKPQEFRVWSLAYVRFWIVKTLVRSNPLLLLIGGRARSSTASPILNFYLRALGAKIGPGVAIFSRNFPVCTDLLTIGAGTVIRKDSFISCYRAHDGMIQTGPVTLGKDVFVGEMTVIDIDTSMGDGSQLGHASSLHRRQAVPAGESWHGSPAQRAEVDYRVVDAAPGAALRATMFGITQLLTVLVLVVPVLVGGLVLLLVGIPQLNELVNPGPLAFTTWAFYENVLLISAVLFAAYVVVGLLFVGTVPRLLNRAIKPDTVYPLYGFHYGIHKAIARMTNIRFLVWLFGDSSYIVNYLQWVGYDLSTVVQSGSNFGTDVRHENPYLTTIGSGTMVADGLSIINADFSSTSFKLSRATIGGHSFLGNQIAYPAQSTAGDNCLLATKVMVPVGGKVREGTGLLGAPSFEIPRSVERDTRLHDITRVELRRRLKAKNRHNLVTMALYLLSRWAFFFGVLMLDSFAAVLYYGWDNIAIALASVASVLFSIVYWTLAERLVKRFQDLEPLYCSIHDRAFWRHERYWKIPAQAYLLILNGTPFKNLAWRLLGVKIGRRVFDDGAMLTERTLAHIGDDCTLNASTTLQCHSQEDGTFKSDHITLGARCTLAVGAFVHYGVTMADDSVLETSSFLMKGEEVPPHARWAGNPATALIDDRTRPLVKLGDARW